jgi:hypothetical protein
MIFRDLEVGRIATTKVEPLPDDLSGRSQSRRMLLAKVVKRKMQVGSALTEKRRSCVSAPAG